MNNIIMITSTNIVIINIIESITSMTITIIISATDAIIIVILY